MQLVILLRHRLLSGRYISIFREDSYAQRLMRLEFVIADRRRRFLVNFGLRLVSVSHQYVDVKSTPLLGYVQGDLYS